MGDSPENLKCAVCGTESPSGAERCPKCEATLVKRAPDEEDRLVGTVVAGRFLVLKRLGAGGMGVVYQAEQLSVHRVVALKILHLQRYIDDKTLAARFRTEAEAASRLTNPHTVTVFDFGEAEGGALFMAMEFLKGQTLTEELRSQGPLRWPRAFAIAEQIAGSIAEAHKSGIVHRDLKPDNVILVERNGETGFAKVLDFGIAKVLEPSGTDRRSHLTRTGMIFGTPQYMAPEQIRGEAVSPATDVYALGVMLYEMLAGRLPFTHESPMAILTMHLADKPPPLKDVAAGLPAEVVRIVERAMSKSAGDRYPSMDDLSHDMRRLRETEKKAVVAAETIPSPVQKKTGGAKVPAWAIAMLTTFVVVSASLFAYFTYFSEPAPTTAAIPIPLREATAETPQPAPAPPTPALSPPVAAVPDAGAASSQPPEPKPAEVGHVEASKTKDKEPIAALLCKTSMRRIDRDGLVIGKAIDDGIKEVERCLGKGMKTGTPMRFVIRYGYGGGKAPSEFAIDGDDAHKSLCLTRTLRAEAEKQKGSKEVKAAEVEVTVDQSGTCWIRITTRIPEATKPAEKPATKPDATTKPTEKPKGSGTTAPAPSTSPKPADKPADKPSKPRSKKIQVNP